MRPKKRLFIGLQLTSLLLIVLTLLFFAYFSLVDAATFSTFVLYALFAGAALIVLFSGLGILGVVLTIVKGSPVRGLEVPTRLALNVLFPVTLWLGKLIQISRERIARSFIEVNNQLNYARGIAADYSDLVLLLPHCLQYAHCPHKITMDIDNCRRCGRCKIGALLEYKDDYGIDIYVVTGGTLARKVLREKRPRAVVAVACERDLVSGLQDVFPLPAQGVVNIRPEGPCINTDVDLKQVDKAIQNFTG